MATALLCALPSLHSPPAATRRAILAGAALTTAPRRGRAAVAPPPGFEVFEPAPSSRVQGIGGGADMLAEDGPAVDVLYPPSLLGLWRCERVVTSVEGDALQAEGAWRLLGGDGEFRRPESYLLKYVPQPGAEIGPDGKMVGPASLQPITGADGRKYFGVVLDRGSREHVWSVASTGPALCQHDWHQPYRDLSTQVRDGRAGARRERGVGGGGAEHAQV